PLPETAADGCPYVAAGSSSSRSLLMWLNIPNAFNIWLKSARVKCIEAIACREPSLLRLLGLRLLTNMAIVPHQTSCPVSSSNTKRITLCVYVRVRFLPFLVVSLAYQLFDSTIDKNLA